MHNQQFLNNYFSEHWQSSTANYMYSGYAILDNISSTDTVVDIGCGSNPFKGEITNLIGIDPAHNNADVCTTIEDYKPNAKFTVALCLGSINFGSDTIIANQIEKVNDILEEKAKVFWRLNPGMQDHESDLCEEIDFYPWSFEKLHEFAEQYGFKQVNCAKDTDGQNTRLYAEWVR